MPASPLGTLNVLMDSTIRSSAPMQSDSDIGRKYTTQQISNTAMPTAAHIVFFLIPYLLFFNIAEYVREIQHGFVNFAAPSPSSIFNFYPAKENHPRKIPGGFLYSTDPSPPMSAVSSSIRSSGNGGNATSFMVMDISFIGLSSAAARLECSTPHLRVRPDGRTPCR